MIVVEGRLKTWFSKIPSMYIVRTVLVLPLRLKVNVTVPKLATVTVPHLMSLLTVHGLCVTSIPSVFFSSGTLSRPKLAESAAHVFKVAAGLDAEVGLQYTETWWVKSDDDGVDDDDDDRGGGGDDDDIFH